MDVVIKREVSSKRIELSLHECHDGTIDVLAKNSENGIELAILNINDKGLFFYHDVDLVGIETNLHSRAIKVLGVKDFYEIDVSND